ncbi:MAG: sigma factor-like helix-turn-helix DNA-binding protein, partial [Oscillospiraceae bacterium]
MDRTTFSLEIFGDRLPIYGNMMSAGDNVKFIGRMKNSLNSAIETELTDRQREIIRAFYFDGLSVTEIANRLELNK